MRFRIFSLLGALVQAAIASEMPSRSVRGTCSFYPERARPAVRVSGARDGDSMLLHRREEIHQSMADERYVRTCPHFVAAFPAVADEFLDRPPPAVREPVARFQEEFDPDVVTKKHPESGVFGVMRPGVSDETIAVVEWELPLLVAVQDIVRVAGADAHVEKEECGLVCAVLDRKF